MRLLLLYTSPLSVQVLLLDPGDKSGGYEILSSSLWTQQGLDLHAPCLHLYLMKYNKTGEVTYITHTCWPGRTVVPQHAELPHLWGVGLVQCPGHWTLLALWIRIPMPPGGLPLLCRLFPLMFLARYGVVLGKPPLLPSRAWSLANCLLGCFWSTGFPASSGCSPV